MKKTLALVALVATLLGLTSGIALALEQFGFASQTNGGGMQTDDGVLDWAVPAAASPYNMSLQYKTDDMNALPALPADTIFVKAPFTLRIWDFDSGNLVTTDKQMTLTIHYDLAELGGRSESTLKVVRLNDIQWLDQSGTVDTANHVMRVQANGSGDFALIASNAAPAPAPAPTPEPAPAPAPAPAQAPAAAPAPAPAPAASADSSISGRVFFDKAGNYVMDGDDFPINGAGLRVTSGSFSVFTRTDANGRYTLGSLGDGSYTLELVVGPEWAFTTPNVIQGIKVNGQPGTVVTADFGMWYKAP